MGCFDGHDTSRDHLIPLNERIISCVIETRTSESDHLVWHFTDSCSVTIWDERTMPENPATRRGWAWTSFNAGLAVGLTVGIPLGAVGFMVLAKIMSAWPTIATH